MGANGHKPVCVWVSRHAPTPEHRQSLAAYDIRELNGWFTTGDDVWQIVSSTYPNVGLIMAVLPYNFYHYVISAIQASGRDVPIIRPLMVRDGDGWKWTGQWMKVLGTQLKVEEWSP